jgi:hypothetical protein
MAPERESEGWQGWLTVKLSELDFSKVALCHWEFEKFWEGSSCRNTVAGCSEGH